MQIADMFIAAESGNLSEVIRFVERGIDVNSKDTSKGNWTSLHYASKSGHLEVVKYLIDKAADINLVTPDEATALHLATGGSSRVAVAEYLISKGANVNARDRVGDTPLHFTWATKHAGSKAELLIRHGVNLFVSATGEGLCCLLPVHLAMMSGTGCHAVCPIGRGMMLQRPSSCCGYCSLGCVHPLFCLFALTAGIVIGTPTLLCHPSDTYTYCCCYPCIVSNE